MEDPKQLTGSQLCKARGHNWKYFEEGNLLGKCDRCGKELLRNG